MTTATEAVMSQLYDPRPGPSEWRQVAEATSYDVQSGDVVVTIVGQELEIAEVLTVERLKKGRWVLWTTEGEVYRFGHLCDSLILFRRNR